MTPLDIYNSGFTEERKNAEYEFKKETLIPKLEWINQWMEAHNKEVIFTDVDNWKAVGEDYAYFWMLTTEKDFVKEEAEARLGISGRKPVPAIYLEEYEAQICEMMETLKSEL